MKLHELTDMELLEAYKKTEDGTYFQELFHRYYEKIRRACLQFFRGNHSLAEDASQETFRKALEKIRDCATENVGGWLYTIARHCCIDLHRKQWSSLNENLMISRSEPHQEKQLHLDEIKKRINDLGEKQRISLKLYIEGYSYREITEITHYTEKEVKAAIQGAKENLRKLFSIKKGERA